MRSAEGAFVQLVPGVHHVHVLRIIQRRTQIRTLLIWSSVPVYSFTCTFQLSGWAATANFLILLSRWTVTSRLVSG